MTFKVILNFIKILCLFNVDILDKFQKDWALNKKKIAKEYHCEFLRLPFITFMDLLEVILQLMKNLRHYIVSIQRIFYQNFFINECARKKKAKILESRSPGVF